jgi:hypothetical protein
MAPPHDLAVGLSDEGEEADVYLQRNFSDWNNIV